MAHHDLSVIKTEEDITDELLTNDEEHKTHNKTRLLISQKLVEALKYKAEMNRQLAINALKRGEICSISSLVEFNKAQVELNAELQYQELLAMDLWPRLVQMRKIANQLESMHKHGGHAHEHGKVEKEESPDPQRRPPRIISAKADEEGSAALIPIQKKVVKGRTVNL